jgi:hypothetical protein
MAANASGLILIPALGFDAGFIFVVAIAGSVEREVANFRDEQAFKPI